jgi:DNA-directed RNA polymerase specialized sigma24 family protein
MTRDLREGTSSTLSAAIVAAKRGDADALRYLYVRHADGAHAYARDLVGEGRAADDAMGAVFGRLERTIAAYDPSRGSFPEWLLGEVEAIVEVTPARRAEERARTRRLPFEEGSPRLATAFARLPADQRQVLLLSELVGLPPREIADRMGRDEHVIAGLQAQGHATLRETLAKLEPAGAAS